MERETLTILKACDVVGVSRRTIYNWIAANKVEYVRTAGGSIRIFVDTLWRSGPAREGRGKADATDQKPTAAPATARLEALTGRPAALPE